MKVNQIATIMNDTFNEVIGESAIIAEDLSNLVEVGRQITSTSTFGDNINKYTKTIWDKVGETLYNNVEYQGNGYNIYSTNAEYGSVLEKIRIVADDFEDNEAWNFTVDEGSTHDDMFGYHPANVKAKYWDSIVTFRTKPVTVTEKQLRSAFNSQNEMSRFIGMLETAYISKVRLAMGQLTRKLVNGLIAEKFNAETTDNKLSVINLRADYNTNFNKNLTASNCLADADFLKYVGSEIKKYIDFLTAPTMLYNNDGFVNFTNRDDIHVIMISDLKRNLETYLYSDTYNKEDVELDIPIEITPYWQGSGTSNSLVDRSTINVKVPSDNTKTVNETGIMCVIFDKRACMINAKKLETGVSVNNFDNWQNYIWKQECGCFIDAGENCVVFTIKDTE